MFIYFMAIWNILWRFGIFYDHLVHFVFIWYIFSGFGIIYQEKSGNPGQNLDREHSLWRRDFTPKRNLIDKKFCSTRAFFLKRGYVESANIMGYLHNPMIFVKIEMSHDTKLEFILILCAVSYDISVHLSDCVNRPLARCVFFM
jgi:hypothetical protein